MSLDKDKGIDLLKDVLEKIRSVIVEKKGSMNVKMVSFFCLSRVTLGLRRRELMSIRFCHSWTWVVARVHHCGCCFSDGEVKHSNVLVLFVLCHRFIQVALIMD